MVAIFLYVGVEVSTAANLPEFMRIHTGTEASKVAPYVSLFWASLMIGRWTSSVGTFTNNSKVKLLLNVVIPYAAFGFFLAVNYIAGTDVSEFFIYTAVIAALIIADILSKGNPAMQLMIFSCAGIIALITGIFATGMVSTYAFISVGLFCSTLWPCIFTLAITGLGKYTNTGSGYLIMMIMGGGIVSLLQGILAEEKLLGIQNSYIVGVACFAYLAWYALKSKKILSAQGIEFNKSASAGGH
jgi:FHS family L-fucose permease-like MFS transporter